MSVARKPRPFANSRVKEETDRQESLRQVKMAAEAVKESLQKSIMDNPRVAKKAALLISLWIDGKGGRRKPR